MSFHLSSPLLLLGIGEELARKKTLLSGGVVCEIYDGSNLFMPETGLSPIVKGKI